MQFALYDNVMTTKFFAVLFVLPYIGHYFISHYRDDYIDKLYNSVCFTHFLK